jgi:N-acetylmuramoyl-L-alanine amidase
VKRLIVLFALLFFGYSKEIVVAVDIGHTPKRFGALSSQGVKEYDYNYKLASTLNDYLKKSYGFRAYLINPAKKEISLKERVKVAKEKGANLFLSIHHDSVKMQFLKSRVLNHKRLFFTKDKRFSGYSIFVSTKNPHFKESLEIAKAIGKSLKRAGFKASTYHNENIKGEQKEFLDRASGVYRYDGLFVLRKTASPAVLIEAGVIVNPDEEKILSTKNFRDKFSRAVVLGLRDYFKKALSQR